jgi:hypothetical protein
VVRGAHSPSINIWQASGKSGFDSQRPGCVEDIVFLCCDFNATLQNHVTAHPLQPTEKSSIHY